MDPDPATGQYPLHFSVQIALSAEHIPSRQQWRAWAAKSLLGPVNAVLRIVDEDEGLSLNHQFRQRDYATNVLTFPYGEDEQGALCGDIALCWPVVLREASAQDKTLQAHCAHMLVHGMLHLQGLDHLEAHEAAEMEALEIRILSELGFPDPYIVHHQGS
jgi:probable rRNA maturation factor